MAAATGGATEPLLPVAAPNGAADAGAANEKNLFVGVGGMRDLLGQPAVGGGYGGGFANSGVCFLSGVTGRLRGIGGGVGSVRYYCRDGSVGGFTYRGYNVGSTRFTRLGGGYGGST